MGDEQGGVAVRVNASRRCPPMRVSAIAAASFAHTRAMTRSVQRRARNKVPCGMRPEAMALLELGGRPNEHGGDFPACHCVSAVAEVGGFVRRIRKNALGEGIRSANISEFLPKCNRQMGNRHGVATWSPHGLSTGWFAQAVLSPATQPRPASANRR